MTNSKKTPNYYFTLASIIELEGVSKEDRKMISGVFNNRIKVGMRLGSDVTTYYGAKIEMSERDLTKKELDAVNDYNTRPASMNGKLPIGLSAIHQLIQLLQH